MLKKYFLKERPFMISTSAGIKPSTNAFYGPWDSQEDFFTWFESVSNIDYLPSGIHVAIKQADGTTKEYRVQHPTGKNPYFEEIGAGGTTEQISSDNVIMPNGSSVTDVINSITGIEVNITGAVYFNTVAALKASTVLKTGDIAITKGYYSENDGGGSVFRIVSSNSYTNQTWTQSFSGETVSYLDDATLIQLGNGVFADIIVPANEEISFLQLGAEKMSINHTASPKQIRQHNNKVYMLKWLAFIYRKAKAYTLYIPTGVYSFSETWLINNGNNACCLGIKIRGELAQNSGGGGTIIIPHYSSQNYIWRIGYKTNDIDYSGSVSFMPMRGVVLTNLSFGTTRYAWQGDGLTFQGLIIGDNYTFDDDATVTGNFYRYVTKGALWLDSCPYGQFDGLYFSCVAGTCMYLTQCYESHFGYTNIRQCGRITATGYIYPLVYINAPGASDVSACYFYYFNFEENIGNFFYSANHNFSHNEFNNIQIEGKLLNVSSAISNFSSLSSNQKYDTDENYTTPAQNEGEVFGKWIKLFVFTGNMGFMPNYVNSISASNFGNGFKRYRTYSMNDGVLKDMYGNTITDGYVLENGTYYAVDANDNKIVDYYRYYALFGIDENNPSNVDEDNNDNKYFDSFVWNIGSVYLYRYGGMTNYNGPWVVYLRCSATTFKLVVNHCFDRNEYPYYFDKINRVDVAKGACIIPGAVSFADLIQNNASVRYVATKNGSVAPNGICLNLHGTINGFSFNAAPNTKYYIRAYCPQSRYDSLVSTNNGRFNWGGLFNIGGTDYSTNTYITINNAGWITLPMPDLNLTDITKITFGNYTGGDAYSKNFFRNLYLDVIIN